MKLSYRQKVDMNKLGLFCLLQTARRRKVQIQENDILWNILPGRAVTAKDI